MNRPKAIQILPGLSSVHISQILSERLRMFSMAKVINLMASHRQYFCLGKTFIERQASYRHLFLGRMAERDLVEIRNTTNKFWA